ncbi:FMN-dependent NADH-azoreductase [Phenylobacterium terrae]|uniref:FMN dependent NADH:quinone oxidoreductase n=1 Tax=Phenylobacterium terrae TaxID=2665495 RepID=A0ABW4N6Q4_9CAUL
MKLLHVDAGITGPESVSRQISAAVVDAYLRAEPTLEVVRRDLEADPAPHLDGRGLASLPDNAILREFLEADVLVIGAPMYNFGIASQLKAWFDHVLVAGRTFKYGPAGPEGLAAGKRAILASSRGGLYAPGTPGSALDFQEPHLRAMLRHMGVEDITVIRAEGVALSPEARSQAIAEALLNARAVARDFPRRVAA